LEQAKLGKSVEKVLEGRVTYVTGAGSGIGRAVAMVSTREY
jgi:NADP-dependent 3-hydroxy acid dehydrogenase YdfG